MIVVIAGPNGAGKSTAAPSLLQRTFGSIEFVNADTIARGLSGIDPDRQAFAAGRIMLTHIHNLAAMRRNFAFETTLASRTFAPFLQRLKADRYRVHLVYFWVRSVDIAVHRVQLRVVSGGHSVPEATIRRRYYRSAHNLFHLYMPIVDVWEVVDNSLPHQPEAIAIGGLNDDTMIYKDIAWQCLENLRNAT